MIEPVPVPPASIPPTPVRPASTAPTPVRPVSPPGSGLTASEAAYGLFRPGAFVVGPGAANPGCTTRHARWYFESETVALPADEAALPRPAPGMRAEADLAAWAAAHASAGLLATAPPLIWVAAPHVVAHARLAPDGATLRAGEAAWSVRLIPQSPLIKDFFNAASAQWFARRDVRVRATLDGATALVRTIWPEDFRLPDEMPLAAHETLPLAPERIRALVRRDPHGGAAAPFEASHLWTRHPASPVPAGRPVLGFILNGAQGDDDEAHGGHFAIVTGRTRADGGIADWLANNFYTLDSVSEKSIIAAPVPLDNYLADLNSGQGYYRPSVLAVAVLASDRAANAVQDALDRTYVQLYRHQIAYDHAAMNCAGISVDVLRALGLDVRRRGPAAAVRATIGLPWLLVREGWAKGRGLYDYLTEDQTRLMPAAAFEEIVAALTRCAAGGRGAAPGLLDAWLCEDLETLLLLRFPQFPTARPWGDAPVVTPFEYRARWPADPKDARIFPVPPRPFPDALRDPDLVARKRRHSWWAVAGWTVVLALLLALAIAALPRA